MIHLISHVSNSVSLINFVQAHKAGHGDEQCFKTLIIAFNPVAESYLTNHASCLVRFLLKLTDDARAHFSTTIRLPSAHHII